MEKFDNNSPENTPIKKVVNAAQAIIASAAILTTPSCDKPAKGAENMPNTHDIPTLTIKGKANRIEARVTEAQREKFPIVIDAGHGGSDSGAIIKTKEGTIFENECAYDVALRLDKILREGGLKTTQTIIDPKEHEPTDEKFPREEKNETLRSTGKVPSGDATSLGGRTSIANTITTKDPKAHPFFVSIHLDSISDKSISGASIITPMIGPFTNALEENFRRRGLLRQKKGEEYHPVRMSGDKEHGIKKIFVLRDDKNSAPYRVLIELGNLQNAMDRKRFTDPHFRDVYAETIAEAIFEVIGADDGIKVATHN